MGGRGSRLPSHSITEVKPINILALDQSRTGAWSVYNYESRQLLASGAFTFPNAKYTYAQAILHIEELVTSLFNEYEVGAVFIEDIQLRANVQAFKRLAQLQGVLINLFEKNEYLYGFVAPSKWQSYCRARARTTKEVKANVTELAIEGKKESKMLSIQFIKDLFGIDTTDDNLADAICIGWYAVNEIKIEKVTSPDVKKKTSKSKRK